SGPLLRWAAAAAALAVLAVGLDYTQLMTERGALSTQAEKIYSSAMPSGSGGAGRKIKMEMRLRELTGKADAASAGSAGSPLALLAALSRDVPKSLGVVVDQVEHSPPAAKVVGHATSFETVTKMQEALQKGGAFSRVEVKDVHASVTGGGVEFLLELSTTRTEGGA
ncbi:MAG: PilN domain-containing protein, partial [Candidatus Binatia bacterium]